MKKSKLIIFLMGLALILSTIVVANDAQARTVWVKGKVTKAVWHGQYRYIMVDHKKYTLMPNAVLRKYPHNRYGDSFSFEDVQVGQKVFIKVQGRRIYEMVIEE